MSGLLLGPVWGGTAAGLGSAIYDVMLGGYSFFRVVTGSMEPQIPVGAMLISQETDIEDLKIGDIICFSALSPDMYGRCITHRVIGISEGADGADDSSGADAEHFGNATFCNLLHDLVCMVSRYRRRAQERVQHLR